MECSWILIWVPTKQRENLNKGESSAGGSRKISRLFSENETKNTQSIKKLDQESRKLSVPTDPSKDTQEINLQSLKDKEDCEPKKRSVTDENTIQDVNSSDKKNTIREGGLEPSAAGSRASTTSTRFQIQRQLTAVLDTKEEDKESEEEEEEPEEKVFDESESYEERLESILLSLNVQATGLQTKDNGHTLVTLCLENNRVEDFLLQLQEKGIGNSPSETSISVLPASVHFEVPLKDDPNSRY